MKLSVVIPTYNRANDLKRALNSLKEQTFKEFEVLVCDDGSTDDTKSVVDGYKNNLNIRHFYEDNWGGPARPRNIGIANATTEWVCFLDSDDWWTHNKMEELWQSINKHTAEVYFHRFICENKTIGIYHVERLSSIYEDLLINGNRIVNSSLCVKKEVLITINGLREDKKIIGNEDYDLLIRLAKSRVRFHSIDQSLGWYNIGENNISANFSEEIKKIEYMLSLHKTELGLERKKSALIAYMKGSNMLDLKNSTRMSFFWSAFIDGSKLVKAKSLIKMAKFILKGKIALTKKPI